MKESFPERRREPRLPASGAVRLVLVEGAPIRTLEGRLVDTSLSGFRAAHGYAGLASGQEVEFETADRRGRARVAWTRVAAGEAESGFFLVG
ncbi:MAG: PilZ domain-containing protein [Bryobacteraceae bacterium]